MGLKKMTKEELKTRFRELSYPLKTFVIASWIIIGLTAIGIVEVMLTQAIP